MGFQDCNLVADAVGDAFADKGHSAADGDGAGGAAESALCAVV